MAEKPNILQPRFLAGYGADCHMKGSGYIPVCVVTDLKNNILIRNMEPSGGALKWLVTRARVSINRYWTSSNAVIRCTISSEDLGTDFPAVAENQQIARLLNQNIPSGAVNPSNKPVEADKQRATPLRTRSGSAVTERADEQRKAEEAALKKLASMRAETQNIKTPLDILDEICIYTGYIDSLRPVGPEDIKAGRLKRIFVGVIDTITATGTNREGTNLMIQCRDRMKYLMDSLGTFNPSDTIDLSETLDLNQDSKTGSPRSSVILTIARRSVGDLRNVKSISASEEQTACNFVGGVGIDPGLVVDFASDKDGKITQFYADEPTTLPNLNPYSPYDPGFGLPPVPGQIALDSRFSLSGDLKTHKEFPSPVMRFNILTGRPGYEKGDLVSNFQVTDRIPIEFIKYLSLQEPWPTELFAHHQTGEYWYVPRGTDVSGFEDPKRYYRTYFYRRYPSDLKLGAAAGPPHIAQMCLSFREERSAIGWRSNIIISSGVNKATPDNSPSILSGVHITIRPPWLEGRVTPTSYYTAVDPTASSAATLGAMAISFARNLGKETKVASARFLGDPTFSPGEAVQVMGSPLNPNPITDQQRKDDVALATTLRDSYRDLSIFLADKIKEGSVSDNNLTTPADNKAFKKPASITKADPEVLISTKLLCPALFRSLPKNDSSEQSTAPAAEKLTPGNGDIEFVEEPKSVWRIEGVTHYYNDGETGYFTELSLLSAF